MNNAQIILACLLLAGCPSKKPEQPGQHTEGVMNRFAQSIEANQVEIEYSKRLSDAETIRGLRIPYSGNIFTGGADDVRCLLYVNDTYRTTQIICPDSSERHPRDVIVETGTEEPYN